MELEEAFLQGLAALVEMRFSADFALNFSWQIDQNALLRAS